MAPSEIVMDFQALILDLGNVLEWLKGINCFKLFIDSICLPRSWDNHAIESGIISSCRQNCERNACILWLLALCVRYIPFPTEMSRCCTVPSSEQKISKGRTSAFSVLTATNHTHSEMQRSLGEDLSQVR